MRSKHSLVFGKSLVRFLLLAKASSFNSYLSTNGYGITIVGALDCVKSIIYLFTLYVLAKLNWYDLLVFFLLDLLSTPLINAFSQQLFTHGTSSWSRECIGKDQKLYDKKMDCLIGEPMRCWMSIRSTYIVYKIKPDWRKMNRAGHFLGAASSYEFSLEH